jgi:hypothetical protein
MQEERRRVLGSVDGFPPRILVFKKLFVFIGNMNNFAFFG